MMIQKFTRDSFHKICDQLAVTDKHLRMILDTHRYPPMWTRPNNFETLVHIILEQQVSLASALAALNKLKDKIKTVTPANFVRLTDEELKACYFSRQKTVYTRELAAALLNGSLDLQDLETLPDDDVRAKMIELKGIGNWTIDVYLMFVLQRADIFPVGDLAAVNALRRVKKLSREVSRERILKIAAKWRPYRTVATMILWHLYLSSPMRRLSATKDSL